MRRRAFVATAGAVALAGCTASGDEEEVDIEEYAVRGLEESSIYHGYELLEKSTLFAEWIEIGLRYDTEADYDPLEYETILLDGHDKISEGEEDNRSLADDGEEQPDLVTFEVSAEHLRDGGPYRVVSKDDAGVVEEFEIEVVRDD